MGKTETKQTIKQLSLSRYRLKSHIRQSMKSLFLPRSYSQKKKKKCKDKVKDKDCPTKEIPIVRLKCFANAKNLDELQNTYLKGTIIDMIK